MSFSCMIVNVWLINAGALASSTHVQAAIDQWGLRNGIFINCSLNCKSIESKENCKNATSKAYKLTQKKLLQCNIAYQALLQNILF